MLLMETSRQAKIRQLDVPLSIDKDIVGLNVTMNKAKLMNTFESQDTFGNVKSRHILLKRIVFNQHCHEITARKKFHQQVQVCRVLE